MLIRPLLTKEEAEIAVAQKNVYSRKWADIAKGFKVSVREIKDALKFYELYIEKYPSDGWKTPRKNSF